MTPLLSLDFLVNHVAENAALFFIVVTLGVVHFFVNALRHNGQSDELRMGVFERSARRLAVIFEQQDVAEAPIVLQIHHAITVGPQSFLDGAIRHRRHRKIVVRRFNNYFVSADAVHVIEEAVAFTIQAAFDSEGGKLVRHDANRPARSVPARAFAAVGEDFRRRHAFVSGAEGTNTLAFNLDTFANKIARPFPALGGNDHPAAGNRIFAQLRQNTLPLRLTDLAHLHGRGRRHAMFGIGNTILLRRARF